MGDRAVLITVQHQSTVLAAIGPPVQRHGLQMPAPAAPLGTIAFIYVRQRLPSQDAFVLQHLDKAVETPIVVHRPMQGLQVLGVFFRDHLPLGQVSYHNGAFNQCVGDEVACFVQRVLAFIPLPLRDAPIDP
jgi:hypothetical protein